MISSVAPIRIHSLALNTFPSDKLFPIPRVKKDYQRKAIYGLNHFIYTPKFFT